MSVNKRGNADKMKEGLLVVFLDINSNRSARDFTGGTAFMIFPSQIFYFILLHFMEFNNVLRASSTGKINPTKMASVPRCLQSEFMQWQEKRK